MKTKTYLKLSFYHRMGLFLILGLFLFPSPVLGSALQKLSEKELANLADVVVVGQVSSKEARWVGRHIETTVSVRAKEYWKGNLGDSFELTQMGGEVQRPLPIAMKADGAPEFFMGEQVILFLENPKPNPNPNPNSKVKNALPPDSKLPNSCKVVGWAQGKYTIIRDSKTNQDKIIRLGMEDMTVLSKHDMEKRIEAARIYSGLASKNEEKPVKTKQNQGAAPMAGKMGKKASSGADPAKVSESEVKVASLDKDSLAILDLPKRENLEVFKTRIMDILK
ncbi:hypothetical protein JW926_07170 [Candidatus Sumerlaeota bacterium]|nr:hypothetical protein [Candidatus Sumerlaeota bacterium]